MTTLLTRTFFSDMSDSIFWNEVRSARVNADVEWLADAITNEVVTGAGDGKRRATFTEEIVDSEAWTSFVRDLLDDVRNNVDPTGTIKRSVYCWALSVAEYEVSRGEA